MKSGERRNATILFADLEGFTALSERMDPEEIDTLMSRLFGAFEEIIVARGGVVEKYIGDALVAVFGVGELHEDDPQRAIESALAFLERNRSLEGELAPRGTRLSFRIGIHSGLIATGDRGSFKVVTGHPMAIAQRLQSAALPDRVLVSEVVKEHCQDDYEFEGPTRLAIKGASDTVNAWSLIGATQIGIHDSSPFLGRQEALEDLLRVYVRHDPSMSTGLYLVGEAGIGKSRLIQSFTERVRSFPEFSSPVMMAKAQKYRPVRYAVVVDLVLEYLGVDPASGSEAIASTLSALPGMERIHAERFAGLLEPAGSSAQDSELVLSLFSIFSNIMERQLRAVYPALLLVDNAQAMDRQSRDFLVYYIKNGVYKPFTLMAGRDQPQALRDAFPGIKTLRLEPLPRKESRMLALSHWPDIPERLLEAVLSQSGGNPLFIREYTQFARKHKDLSSLPGSIQNMFMASLDRYEPRLRDFVTSLSVFLLNFNIEEAGRIYEAAGGEPDYAQKALERLAADGILTKKGDYYSFTLDVFKKSLYASILNHNKKVLHGVVADGMLQNPARNRLRLLHHLLKSERWGEAADAILSDKARNYNLEYLEYLESLYKRLVRQSPDSAVQLLITKSSIYFNAGKIAEAEGDLQRVMRIAVSERNESCMGFAYHMICAHNAMSATFQKARFTGQKALYYYKRAGMATRSVQNVLRHIAYSEMLRNNFEEARSLVDRMAQMPGRDEFEYVSALAENRLFAGDYRGALAAIDGGAVPSDEAYLLIARFFGIDLRLKILWQLCDFKALAPAARSLLETGELSDASVAQAQAMLATSATLSGDLKTAREAFMQAEYYADKVRNDFDRVESLRTLANCHYIAGNIKKAELAAREALLLGLRHSCYYPAFTALMLLVQMAAGRSDPEEARFFLAEASFLFETGLLLPNKDTIVYYYYQSRLGNPESVAKSAGIAHRLLEDEKSRLEDPELIASFLSVRGFGDMESVLEGRGEDRF